MNEQKYFLKCICNSVYCSCIEVTAATPDPEGTNMHFYIFFVNPKFKTKHFGLANFLVISWELYKTVMGRDSSVILFVFLPFRSIDFYLVAVLGFDLLGVSRYKSSWIIGNSKTNISHCCSFKITYRSNIRKDTANAK
jgi:hypothetical protein